MMQMSQFSAARYWRVRCFLVVRLVVRSLNCLYQAVAIVLAYIYRVDRGEDLERPDVELPEDMRFDEFGKPLVDGAGGV